MADNNVLELEKTLQVDGQIYNINAIEANHVENPLVIYKSNLNKKAAKLLEFDGSSAKSLDIVPASGGSFAGRITVPPVSNSTLNADGETVLNYNDIVSRVVDRLLNTSAMATWSNNELTFTDTETPAVHGICVVSGTEAGLAAFATANHNNMLVATGGEIQDVSAPKWLPNFLYVCTMEEPVVTEEGTTIPATGSMYFGSADSIDVVKLVPGKGSTITPGSIYIDKTRWIIPAPADNPASYVTYESAGIDMHNSDITNVQGLWFADSSESKNEGIIFLRNQDGMDNFNLAKFYDNNGNHIRVTGDRLYANKDGKLLYDQGIWYYDPKTGRDYNQLNKDHVNDGKTKEVFHSGLVIPVENGGTGQDDLSKVTVGSATKLETSRTVRVSLSSAASAYFDGTTNIVPGVTGILQVANGGTGKTDLADVTVGKASKLNATYVYQKGSNKVKTTETKSSKITISYEEPSGGNDGDIWIKY